MRNTRICAVHVAHPCRNVSLLCFPPKSVSLVYCSVGIEYKTSWGQSLLCYFQNMGSSCHQCVLCIVPTSPLPHCFKKRGADVYCGLTVGPQLLRGGEGGLLGGDLRGRSPCPLPQHQNAETYWNVFSLGRTERTSRKRGLRS